MLESPHESARTSPTVGKAEGRAVFQELLNPAALPVSSLPAGRERTGEHRARALVSHPPALLSISRSHSPAAGICRSVCSRVLREQRAGSQSELNLVRVALHHEEMIFYDVFSSLFVSFRFLQHVWQTAPIALGAGRLRGTAFACERVQVSFVT